MPIGVRVVSEEDYAKWLVTAKEQFASNDPAEKSDEPAKRQLANLPQ